jgi:hypothetical protein
MGVGKKLSVNLVVVHAQAHLLGGMGQRADRKKKTSQPNRKGPTQAPRLKGH